MEINITTLVLLFPAISLLLLETSEKLIDIDKNLKYHWLQKIRNKNQKQQNQ